MEVSFSIKDIQHKMSLKQEAASIPKNETMISEKAEHSALFGRSKCVDIHPVRISSGVTMIPAPVLD